MNLAALRKFHDGKRMAFAAIMLKRSWGLGIAIENEPGFFPCTRFADDPEVGQVSFKSFDEATEAANKLNATIFKLSKKEAGMVVLTSMRGS